MMTMTASITSEQRTAGQEKQYGRVVEDAATRGIKLALAEINPSKDGLERLLASGNELCAAIIETITTQTRELSATDKFADEEVSSSYKYPKGYKGPKPISTQVDILAGIFSLSLGNTSEFLNKVLPSRELCAGAEGRFAVASVDAVAKRFFPEIKDPAERYVRAVTLGLEKLAASRPFYNYREGQLTTENFRRHVRTAHALDLIREKQTGDILVLDAQLGMRHRGRSVRRAREIFNANEFGLGAWEVINIALTHPERLVTYEELDMDCAGDEFDPGEDDGFSHAPVLLFVDGEVKFGANWFNFALELCGSVSGFVPQE
jgi:hypothetical protein